MSSSTTPNTKNEHNWSRQQLQEYNEQFRKLLANPFNELVFDHIDWLKPTIGERMDIISWDTQTNVQECVRVSKLPYVTVKDIWPMVVGKDGITNYWAYTIEIEEAKLQFMQWHYRKHIDNQ